MSNEQILKDFNQYLSHFFDNDEYQLDKVMFTKWHLDQHAFGSFSYYKVGTSKNHYELLTKPIQDRFWFVGEHTNSENYGFIHGAYETGVWAAKEALEE